MTIKEIDGHDKTGKKTKFYFGAFKVKGNKKEEIIFTNNYLSKERAIKQTIKKMKKYTDIIQSVAD